MSVPVVIIGAGPAGIAAAVQLRRGGVDFLLLDKGRIGGLLNEAQSVENFPGVPGGAPGRVLAARLRRQLRASGIAVAAAEVLALARRGGGFALRTSAGPLTAARVILACGTVPVPPGPPLDAERLRGRLFSGVLPLRRVRGETIAVIGGGDAAFDYALSLAAENRVHVLVRAPRPRALPLLVERCRRHRRIVIHQGFPLARAGLLSGGDGVLLEARAGGGRRREGIVCQRVLAAVGRVPALHFLDGDLLRELPEPAGRRRLFLAGDAGNGRFRQAAIAAADGLRAAMEIQAGEARCR